MNSGSAALGWREASTEPPVRRRYNATEQWRACAGLSQTWPQRINGRAGMNIHNCVSTIANEMCYSTSRVGVYVQGGWGRDTGRVGVSVRLPLQEEAAGVRSHASRTSTSHIEAYDDDNIDLHVVSFLQPRASEGKPACCCSLPRSWAEFLLPEGPSSGFSQFIYSGNLGKSST